MDKIDHAYRGGRGGTVLPRKSLISNGRSLLFRDVEVRCVCRTTPPDRVGGGFDIRALPGTKWICPLLNGFRWDIPGSELSPIECGE